MRTAPSGPHPRLICFARALVSAVGGALHELEVTGPVGKHVQACFGTLEGEDEPTAVLEMASAAGLRHVPSDCGDPLAVGVRQPR